jgi:putative tricarboxylic transport membrane protein
VTDAPQDRRPTFAIAPGELLIACAVLALAGIVAWQTYAIPVSPIYARVGPTLAPTLAFLGLGALGLGLLRDALRGGWQSQDEGGTIPDLQALAWLGIGLMLNVVLIETAGFTAASVVMFVCIARAFGSRALARDAALALVFALTAYFGFARLLNIDIGRGIVESAILSAFGLR